VGRDFDEESSPCRSAARGSIAARPSSTGSRVSGCLSRARNRCVGAGMKRLQAAGGDGERSDARQANQGERPRTRWRRQRDDGSESSLGLWRRLGWRHHTRSPARHGRFAQAPLRDHVLLRNTENILCRVVQVQSDGSSGNSTVKNTGMKYTIIFVCDSRARRSGLLGQPEHRQTHQDSDGS